MNNSGNAEWTGTQSEYHSFIRYDFNVGELACTVVVPKQVADGKPWIWRARFLGHEPQTEISLLEKGFHVAYVDVTDLFGSPKALARWDAFYKYLTESHGFDKKVVLEGFSRGGLIIYNWAAENPDKIHCIYADAPVCDLKSWPGGMGAGNRSIKAWESCLIAYDMTEVEVLNYDKNPIDNLQPLALANIPLLHVVGDADLTVIPEENTAILEARYRDLGGSITVIHKEGVGHHPHSLEDPKPIVDFILKYSRSVTH